MDNSSLKLESDYVFRTSGGVNYVWAKKQKTVWGLTLRLDKIDDVSLKKETKFILYTN